MKIPKLLLIYPSCLYAPRWGEIRSVKPHMINLFSFLKAHKIKVEILDLENEIGRPETENQINKFKERTLKLISKFDFDIAAISCWSSLNYLSSILVADICKNINPESVVVVGGYHPSVLPNDFIYPKSPFDIIIRGEGERALLKVTKDKKQDMRNLKLIQGAALNLKEDFALDWRNYKYSEQVRMNYIYLSRGCPFSCSFCIESAKGYHRWRSYAVEKAFREIKRLIDIENPEEVRIADACFGFNKTWRREFLSTLIKNKIHKMFWAQSRIDLFEKKDVDLLAKLNFNIEFGLESGSEEMLHIMQKTNKPKAYLKKCADVISHMNKKEVPYKIYLIFNHPGETNTTFKSTIKFFTSLFKKQNKISGIFGGQNYCFFPGSHTHRHLKHYEEKYGTVVKHQEWWKEQGDHYKLATSIIPSRDLINKNNGSSYWIKDIDRINQQCANKMPIWIRFFRKKRDEIFKR